MKCKGVQGAGFEFGSSFSSKKDGVRCLGINYKIEKVSGALVKAIACTPDGEKAVIVTFDKSLGGFALEPRVLGGRLQRAHEPPKVWGSGRVDAQWQKDIEAGDNALAEAMDEGIENLLVNFVSDRVSVVRAYDAAEQRMEVSWQGYAAADTTSEPMSSFMMDDDNPTDIPRRAPERSWESSS